MSVDLATLLPQGRNEDFTISASISSLGSSKVPKAKEVCTPMLVVGSFLLSEGKESSRAGVEMMFMLETLGMDKLLGLIKGWICFKSAIMRLCLSSGVSLSMGFDDLIFIYSLCICRVSSSSWLSPGAKFFKSFK